MYRVTLTDAYAWGSGAPNPFQPPSSPSFNQNRIFAGEGFRYVNDGTGVGTTESIPVKFSDVTGNSSVSDTLVIHINAPAGAPSITTQPEGITIITSGQTATLHVAATGTGTLHYQWYSGLTPNTTNPIAGATSTTYTTPVLSVGGQYLYWVQVTNTIGVASSLNATVQVGEETTTKATSPANLTYSRSSQTATMKATVSRTVSQTFGIADGDVQFSVAGVASTGNVGFTVNSPGNDTVTGTLSIPARTHAGTYTLSATYAGNIPLYLASSTGTTTLTILKADQTISGFGALATKTFGDASYTIGAGVSATSDPDAGGVTFTSLNPSVAVVNGTTVTIVGAGQATIVASQAGNQDWNPAPDVQQTLTVNQATPKVTVTGSTFTYDNTAHAATAAATGVGGATVSGTYTFTYNGSATTPVNAGTYTVLAHFHSSDPNYKDADSAAGTLVISPGTPTVTISGGPFTYDGQAHAASAAATGVGGSSVTGTFAFTYNGSVTIPSQAGTYTVAATFTTSDPNYTGGTGSGTLVISPATPTITWANPVAISYGTALSATQFNATAGVPGTFQYSPAAGTLLGAGTQTLSVTFTPTDSVDYGSATASVALTVNPATLTVTANNASRSYGAANPSLTASYSGFVNGDTVGVLGGSPSLSTTATPGSAPGNYPIAAAAGSLAAANYTFAFVDGTLTVTQAALVVSTTSLNLGTATPGTAGAARSYSLSGTNLSGNVVVTAPAGVELSSDNGSTWHSSLTLPPSGGTLATTTISARVSASASAGTISGTITNISTGVSGQDVAVSGTVSSSSGLPGGSVVGTQVDDGNVQRSMVRSLTLTFSSAISQAQLATVLANLSLTRASDGLAVGLKGTLDDTGKILTLTFTGSSILGGSLADGRYTLSYGGNTVLGTTQLWRLYGDLYGTASVTQADQTAFMAAYRSHQGMANYRAYFDIDSNGSIDSIDYYQLLRRNGTSI